jgi:signal transduction histidine kinase
MFLKKFKHISKQVGFKMTLWHLGLLVLSSCFLFFVFYFLYFQSLSKKDHEVLEAKFQEYHAIYQYGGIKSLDEYLLTNIPFKENGSFFIRLADSDYKTIYFRSSLESKIFARHEIENSLRSLQENQRWHYVKTQSTEHDLEVLSFKMDSGIYFQIGKTIEDHDVLLQRFKKIFAVILLFAVILGGIGGMLLANKMLTPLRNLIVTLKSLQTGREEVRVPLLRSNDELEELTLLFNRMLDRIQTSNQGMRQTLDTIAHELRTPLTSVRGLAEVTLGKTIFSEHDYRKVLEDCIEGIDEILAEFKMMTDITEVESGLQNLRKESIQLDSVCRDIVDLYEIVAEQKEIKITLTGDPGIVVFADKKKLRQAIANLVDNAIKYSSHHTIIQINFSQLSKHALIKIKDQGIGIPENELPLIWKRLYRGEGSRTEKGIGLGLSLVKSIVEAHQGEIAVEKNVDQGTTFVIWLPI